MGRIRNIPTAQQVARLLALHRELHGCWPRYRVHNLTKAQVVGRSRVLARKLAAADVTGRPELLPPVVLANQLLKRGDLSGSAIMAITGVSRYDITRLNQGVTPLEILRRRKR